MFSASLLLNQAVNHIDFKSSLPFDLQPCFRYTYMHARLDRSISTSLSCSLRDHRRPFICSYQSRPDIKRGSESTNSNVVKREKATNLYTDTSFGSVAKAKAGASVTCFFSRRAAGLASEARTRALTSSTAKGGFQAMAASSSVRSLPQE